MQQNSNKPQCHYLINVGSYICVNMRATAGKLWQALTSCVQFNFFPTNSAVTEEQNSA